jgi:hypothetical protein
MREARLLRGIGYRRWGWRATVAGRDTSSSTRRAAVRLGWVSGEGGMLVGRQRGWRDAGMRQQV